MVEDTEAHVPSQAERIAVLEAQDRQLADGLSELRAELRAHAERSERRHDELMNRIAAMTPAATPKPVEHRFSFGLTPGSATEWIRLIATILAIGGVSGAASYVTTRAGEPPVPQEEQQP